MENDNDELIDEELEQVIGDPKEKDMKLLMENWRNHLQEQDLTEAQTQALNELSENDYEMIKNWMADAPEEAYSFGNIFGNKKRIAIPVETGAAKGPIGDIVRLFQDNGWEINFGDSTVSKKMTTVIPKGPKAGETVSQVRKMRIGKALEYFLKLVKNYNNSAKEYTIGYKHGDDQAPENKILVDKKRSAREKVESALPANTPPYNLNTTLPTMIEFWGNKSEFYRQNPDAAFEKESPYVTILSRHPVDVVRMSDMNHITSCHSRGGGYFQCAVAESRGHGPIAYLVPREQFEQYFDVDLSKTDPSEVDLDQGGEEIFADRERGIPGLKPEGRVRLRKFSDGDTTFAAPERRTYAPHNKSTPPNFLKGVTKWALESQKDVIGDPKVLADAVVDGEFSRFGGSYEDSQDGSVIAAMLEPVIDEETLGDLEGFGNVDQYGEDEDEIETELEGGSIDERAEEIQDRADRELEHFLITHEVMDDGWDGQQSLYFSAHIGFELDDEFGECLNEEGEEIPWHEREDEVNDIIEGVLDSNSVYPEMGNVEIYDDQWRTDWSTYDAEPSVEGFDQFVDEVIRGDENYTDIIDELRQAFSDAGMIERIQSELEKAHTQFVRYKNLGVRFADDNKRIIATNRSPIILDKNYRNFKEYDINTQEAIKSNFNELFTREAYGVLSNIAHDILPLAKVFNDTQQGLLVDLDGVKAKFVIDIPDVVDGLQRHYHTKSVIAVDAAKRFLNLVNNERTMIAINKAATDSYKKAIEIATSSQPKEQEPEQQPEQSKPMPANETKKPKVSDKMLFESWRRYLGK